ncbi:hypothetical protein [Dictyobacter arantiisoli]|uniref:Uncharacterized protein n=1 Tax=Dictyobacter arantiisoli TaxID=2014874 RepID=A0A5A5T763_9CHLR|nr:hypothetical protein [Dictyobacter arantiisoli]GCF06799.1 hypothetical protein KDI_03630 [Dictyobacter arantiisoli]
MKKKLLRSITIMMRAMYAWLKHFASHENKPRGFLYRAGATVLCFVIGLFFLSLAHPISLFASSNHSQKIVMHAVAKGNSSSTIHAYVPGKGGVTSASMNAADPVTICYTNGNGNTGNTSTPDPITNLPQIKATGTATATTNEKDQLNGQQAPICEVPVDATCTSTLGADDALVGTNGLLNSTPAASTYSSGEIVTAEKSMLGIALALLVIPFALAGYQIMLSPFSARYANGVELVGRIIITAAAAAVSLYFIGLAIDFLNGLGATISTISFGTIDPQVIAILAKFFPFLAGLSNVHRTVAIGMPSGAWQCNVHQFLGNIFNLSVYNLEAANQQIDSASQAQKIYVATAHLISNLPNYILTLLTIVLAIQLTVRLVFVNAYIIISPLMIVVGALPGAEEIGPSIMRGWLRGFMGLLAVQFVQLFAAVASMLLFTTAQADFANDPWASSLVGTMIPIVSVMLVLNVPRLLNSSATSMIAQIASSISGSMTGIVLIIRGF